jgi:nucleotide-binding universal stress UspA family protein
LKARRPAQDPENLVKPTGNIEEVTVYKHILIATDGSELASKALAQGLEFGRLLNARVTVVTVTRPFPMPAYGTLPAGPLIEAYEKATAESAGRILASASDAAKTKRIACGTLHAKDEDTAGAVVGTAQSKGCDLIVMGSHGYRGVTRLLLGSVAMKVLTLSNTPVLICR